MGDGMLSLSWNNHRATFCHNLSTFRKKSAGKLVPVNGTGLDLCSPVFVGDVLPKLPDGGFDHKFCLHKHRGALVFAFCFQHPTTGRVLEVYATEPGVQIYTSNYLLKEVKMLGRNGISYTYQDAFCCEPQNLPNAVNQHGDSK